RDRGNSAELVRADLWGMKRAMLGSRVGDERPRGRLRGRRRSRRARAKSGGAAATRRRLRCNIARGDSCARPRVSWRVPSARAAPRVRANVLVRDSRPMIRPVLTEVALFLAPFLVYAVFLWATQAGVLHPNSWSLPRVAWLVIAALVLMIGSFIVLAQWGGSP